MALCPYGQHRLALKEDGTCKRCGADLRLYGTVRELHSLAGQTSEQPIQTSQIIPEEPLATDATGLTIPKLADEPIQHSAKPRSLPARWLAVTVATGLIGWSIGLAWPRRPPLSTLPPAASVVVPTPKSPSLAHRGQQALLSAGVTNAAKLRLVQVDQHTVRIEGEVASLQEKDLIERTLRKVPGVEAVDVLGLTGWERYPVRAGDTLWTLARKWFHDPTQWQRIAAANGLTDPDNLRPGHELIIPR